MRSYFQYLKHVICMDNTEYEELLEELNKNIFEILPGGEFSERDVNRVLDGLSLRREYEEYEYSDDPELLASQWPCEIWHACSFLEFLAALARRMENDFLYEPMEGNRTGVWFMDMIENMGLKFFSGHLSEVDKNNVAMACQTVCERAYNADGSGGNIFCYNSEKKCYTFVQKCYTFENESVTKSVTKCNKNVTFDARKLEIWDQMTKYLEFLGAF